ncbi:GNAT family N-acetyltransferase [Larkinella insperata]|uniref:GNAT family N-acetyltransferase n=1 Tax=Larkinella insperata TaxID=332158 RepID=A0ABW3QM53_9BACT|nr:GNAT family N-acetyltransferase [Larkinella insperata]
MYTLLSLENPLPEQFPSFYRDGFLFLQARHLLHQPCRPLHYLALINTETGLADARCAVYIRDGWVVSPCTASFGSVEFSENVPDAAVGQLLEAVVMSSKKLLYADNKLPDSGIRLVNYPDFYSPNQAQRLRRLLLKAGFTVCYEELNQHVLVDSRPFAEQIQPAQRRRLRKCQQAGFTTQIWDKPDVDKLFTLIQKARHRKGLPVTIQSKDLASLLSNFRDVCPVFTVQNGEELVAACIGIRVTPDILYYFLPADHEDYQQFSPSVLLIESLYAYCQQHGMPWLDLGISTSRGVRNEGLIRFKRQLGAIETSKFIYEMRF